MGQRDRSAELHVYLRLLRGLRQSPCANGLHALDDHHVI